MKRNVSSTKVMIWVCLIFLVVVGVRSASNYYVMSEARHIELGNRLYGPGLAAEQIPKFSANPKLTFSHIGLGMFYLLLGCLQFSEKIRKKYRKLHRYMGRVFAVIAVIIGTSGLIIGYEYAYTGWQEVFPVTLFGFMYLLFLGLAIDSIRNKNVNAHREWMIRHFSIGLAAAGTIRLFIVAGNVWLDLSPNEFVPTAFWLAFTSHVIVAEIWIQRSRSAKLKSGNKRRFENSSYTGAYG